MKPKYLLSLILLLVPMFCYAGETDMLETFIEAVLIFLYGSTAISSYCVYKFYKGRRGLFKSISLSISTCLTIFSILLLLTSYPPPDFAHDKDFQEMAEARLLIAITLLVPNFLTIILALCYKSYPQLETILGRITEDKEIIVWANIKRKVTGKFEVSLHYKRDKWGNFPKKFYSLPEVRGDEERKQYNSIQEAVDYLRDEFNLGLKFVERGELQSEYKKLLNSENSSSTDINL